MSEGTTWFRIGHSTNQTGRTGCTVILFNELVPATVDVRGGAPGTRETALLGSGRLVARADAILLTGGSAFGLAAADGVMGFLAEQGRGFPTGVMPVPIVPTAVIFDLANGEAVWPSAEDGYRATGAATTLDAVETGNIGAGTGATVAKLGSGSKPGGIGVATVPAGSGCVTAVIVLNAVGDIVDPSTGVRLAASVDPAGRGRTGREIARDGVAAARAGENTSIGAILVDAAADRDSLARCCIAAHDALARCVIPAHTIFDGDTFFAAARTAGQLSPSETLGIAAATEIAIEQAIVSIFNATAHQ